MQSVVTAAVLADLLDPVSINDDRCLVLQKVRQRDDRHSQQRSTIGVQRGVCAGHGEPHGDELLQVRQGN